MKINLKNVFVIVAAVLVSASAQALELDGSIQLATGGKKPSPIVHMRVIDLPSGDVTVDMTARDGQSGIIQFPTTDRALAFIDQLAHGEIVVLSGGLMNDCAHSWVASISKNSVSACDEPGQP